MWSRALRAVLADGWWQLYPQKLLFQGMHIGCRSYSASTEAMYLIWGPGQTREMFSSSSDTFHTSDSLSYGIYTRMNIPITFCGNDLFPPIWIIMASYTRVSIYFLSHFRWQYILWKIFIDTLIYQKGVSVSENGTGCSFRISLVHLLPSSSPLPFNLISHFPSATPPPILYLLTMTGEKWCVEMLVLQ